MAEKLPPSNPNNLLSKALGERTIQDEIEHHTGHLENLQSDFYYNKLVTEFGFSRLQARQHINRMTEQKKEIIARLQQKI